MMPEWEEIGIPEGYGPFRLLYNPPSEVVIAELRSIREDFFPNQIYIRFKDSPKYEPIGTHHPMVSAESVVTSLEHPVLFYLSYKILKRENSYGGEWEGLYSFDIQTRTPMKLAGPGSRLPPPYDKGWISSLVEVSANANDLYMTMGMMEPASTEGSQTVDYQLVRMDLLTRRIHPVTRLAGVFF